MKQLNFIDNKKTKPDYKNWVPESLLKNLIFASLAAFVLFIVLGSGDFVFTGRIRLICAIILGYATLKLTFFAIWMRVLHRAFDYNGKRKLAKTIIEGVAEYVEVPNAGVGLDVGCGSGALTIACAKKNPKASMVGCDIWRGSYKTEFSKALCENNAKLEGVENVRFEEGNAVNLPFKDESFDVVTSNYVYHNIPGHNKQKLLLETFRVLKKGGIFVIHDLMSKSRYGDMNKFIEKLKKDGYEDVQLIDTTKGLFMSHKESLLLGLYGSALLIGRK